MATLKAENEGKTQAHKALWSYCRVESLAKLPLLMRCDLCCLTQGNSGLTLGMHEQLRDGWSSLLMRDGKMAADGMWACVGEWMCVCVWQHQCGWMCVGVCCEFVCVCVSGELAGSFLWIWSFLKWDEMIILAASVSWMPDFEMGRRDWVCSCVHACIMPSHPAGKCQFLLVREPAEFWMTVDGCVERGASSVPMEHTLIWHDTCFFWCQQSVLFRLDPDNTASATHPPMASLPILGF